MVQLTVTTEKDQDFEAFTVRAYVRESYVPETYQHLASIDPVRYSYGDIEMILEQDVYHAIRLLEYVRADEKLSSFTVRLPISWVLNGSLSSCSSSVLTCFKANIEKDYELACQVMSLYDIEL